VAVAHLELGDRDLALGRFSQALAVFQAGLRDAPPDQAEGLAQRVRLAASFIGMDVGQPTRASVSFNDKSLTVDQFESLLETQRRRAAANKLLPADQMIPKAATGPPPGQYKLRPVVSWAAAVSLIKGEPAAPTGLALFAAQPAGGIYITGALGTTAIALEEQRIRWSIPLVTDRMSWQTPERMVSGGDRLFWSRPAAEGHELTCLDATSGAVKWHRTRDTLPIISDPVWSQQQLFAVTIDALQQGEWRITLCELNPDTGETFSQTDIGRLVADNAVEPHCALAAVEDRLVLATAAGVLCCDRAGHVHWLQRSTWLPHDIRNLAPDSHPDFALVLQSRTPLIVLQPGAPGLQAFDLETGRRVWQRAIPDVGRIVGSGGGLVIAATPRGLLAFQAADGAFAWQRELPKLPTMCTICDDGLVIGVAVKKGDNGMQQLILQWFGGPDSHNDSVTAAEIPVPAFSSVAGIGSTGDRYFVVGSSQDSSTAWLLELIR
jgi:outer membrane protein assembly factor BamB